MTESTWKRYHSRTAVIDQVLDRARAGVTGVALWSGIPGVWDCFTDEADLLRDLQQRWITSLTAAMDNALETGSSLVDDVRRAYRSAAGHHTELRRVLDEFEAHEALTALVRREHALIARSAGVETADEVLLVAPVPLPTQRRRGVLQWLMGPIAS